MSTKTRQRNGRNRTSKTKLAEKVARSTAYVHFEDPKLRQKEEKRPRNGAGA